MVVNGRLWSGVAGVLIAGDVAKVRSRERGRRSWREFVRSDSLKGEGEVERERDEFKPTVEIQSQPNPTVTISLFKFKYKIMLTTFLVRCGINNKRSKETKYHTKTFDVFLFLVCISFGDSCLDLRSFFPFMDFTSPPASSCS